MSTPTSQPTSPIPNRKLISCNVLMLDGSFELFHIPNKSLGAVLYNEVVHKVQLLEADYFDLRYTNIQGISSWLDHEKPILRQLPQHSLEFQFVVKFYTPDPGLLEEEYTRYLFALQVKRDILTGSMPCQEHTAVLLASYIVQSEYGDFTEEEHANLGYLHNMQLLPKQTEEIEMKIANHHREHFGQSPSEADFNLLDTARKVELYGIHMHNAKDHESVPLHLAVAHMGIVVFQNLTKINTFSWAKIRKLSFKRKKFLVKLHPDGYGYYKDTVEFYFDSRNECKNFWKKCLEHHAFFRCHSVKKLPRNKTRVVSRGSSFRYSGRTQKQLVEYVRDNFVKRPDFHRISTSMRTVSVNQSAAATPKTGTLRSVRDVHMSHHASMSSGSHVMNSDPTLVDDVKSNGRRNRMERIPPTQSRSLQTFHIASVDHNDQQKIITPPSNNQMNHMNDDNEMLSRKALTDLHTGCTLDDFNCLYYKTNYDSGNLLSNKNDEYNRDNASQDSYQLNESRNSLDFDREMDIKNILETDLHINESEFLGQLEKEKRDFEKMDSEERGIEDEMENLESGVSFRKPRDPGATEFDRRKRLSREAAVRIYDDELGLSEDDLRIVQKNDDPCVMEIENVNEIEMETVVEGIIEKEVEREISVERDILDDRVLENVLEIKKSTKNQNENSDEDCKQVVDIEFKEPFEDQIVKLGEVEIEEIATIEIEVDIERVEKSLKEVDSSETTLSETEQLTITKEFFVSNLYHVIDASCEDAMEETNRTKPIVVEEISESFETKKKKVPTATLR